ncbi:MAG: chemotaxis protein CheW [Rhodobacteraceae bacterium]|jgi:purine-binding chemotaxis protein CheW|nr:chemotaxis protein CheW [Paracoccaceae bacterium]
MTPDLSSVLVFRLDGDAFAISVTAVHEILDAEDPTPVPNADAFAPGVINVRGVVVPVVNIRHRLGMDEPLDPGICRMIVVEVPIDDRPQKLAFLADAVEDVLEVDLASAEEIPELGAIWPPVYLHGAVRQHDDLIVVLEPSTLFSPTAAA